MVTAVMPPCWVSTTARWTKRSPRMTSGVPLGAEASLAGAAAAGRLGSATGGIRRRGCGSGRAGCCPGEQCGGLFAPIGQRVLVLLEAGDDSSPARLYTGAQPLYVRGTRGLHVGRDLRRSGLRERRLRP